MIPFLRVEIYVIDYERASFEGMTLGKVNPTIGPSISVCLCVSLSALIILPGMAGISIDFLRDFTFVHLFPS